MRTCKTFVGLFGAAILFASGNSSAASIVGSWYLTNAGQAQSTVVVAFLADGRFMEIEDGNPVLDPSGQDGVEKGSYSWNPITGAFSVNTIINTNGEWGLSTLPPGSTLTATTSSLTLNSSEGSFIIDRLVDPASPIVGAWYSSTGPAAQDLTVVAFLPNGKFMIGIDPPAFGFIEVGEYTWDPLTGALSSTLDESTAPPGSSVNLPSFTSAAIVNRNLVLSSTSGSLTLADPAAVPEPQTFALLAVGLAVLFMRCRKSAVSSKP
jgi:hypothetical protein